MVITINLKKYRRSSFAGYCYLGKRNQSFDYNRLLNTYFSRDNLTGIVLPFFSKSLHQRKRKKPLPDHAAFSGLIRSISRFFSF